MKKVAIIMGSDSDLAIGSKAANTLHDLDIPFAARIISAHRSPDKAAEFAQNARAEGYGAIIAVAGMAAHLAGIMAAHTILPVIGVPVKGGAMDGLDALLATVQMPSGVPVATVALNGGENAALLAAQMLALSDEALACKLEEKKAFLAKNVEGKDQLLQKKIERGEFL